MFELAMHYFLVQLAMTVGVIVVVGVLISLAKRVFLWGCGRAAYHVERVTGWIGTPIHELSHAFFCLIFGHKIHSIRLYTPGSADGCMGCVSHSYQKKNPWHQLGNFFIGIGPILGGSGILVLLLWLLCPDSFGHISDIARVGASLMLAPGGIENSTISQMIWDVFCALFHPSNLLCFDFYLFLLLAFPIVLHMSISGADLKSGFKGFWLLAILLFLSDLLLAWLFPSALGAVTAGCMTVGSYLIALLLIGTVIALLLLIVAIAVRLIRRR